MIQNFKNVVVLTGAGVSVPSGLPDYRSINGLYTREWNGLPPEVLLSRPYFQQNPSSHYGYVIEHLFHPNVVPNVAHLLLAKWEKQGIVKAVITQNIDGLHEKAGSTTIPFHGTMSYVTCNECKEDISIETLADCYKNSTDYYKCPKCNNVYDTNVVLYGDSGYYLGGPGFHEVVQLIQEADLLIIAGTSLKVFPFAGLHTYKNRKCKVWIVNKTDEHFGVSYDEFINGDVVDVFKSWEK